MFHSSQHAATRSPLRFRFVVRGGVLGLLAALACARHDTPAQGGQAVSSTAAPPASAATPGPAAPLAAPSAGPSAAPATAPSAPAPGLAPVLAPVSASAGGSANSLAPVALASCGAVGPNSCEVAPSTPAALCSGLGPCILKHAHDANYLEDLKLSCESPDNGGAPVFVSRVTAPAASGLRATAVAQLVASTDFLVRFGASYLVAEYPEGICLVDVLLDWDQRRSGFDTDFKARWETTAAGLRLHVLAHRVMHDELDEGNKPGADVTANHCERYVYEVRDGKFQRVSHDSRQGPCKGR